jgi:hypothetical protein
LNTVQAASSTSFKTESKVLSFVSSLFVGQQKSLLLSLPHSSGGISAADIKKTGLSFFIALTKFFTKPSFIWSGGKNTNAASTKGL